jgi:O-antigen ligase
MRAVVATRPGTIEPEHSTRVARQTKQSQAAGALASVMLIYIVVAVGRIGDIVPFLSSLPLAKMVAAAAIFVALRDKKALAPTAIWSLAPARLTILFMLLATVSIFFSVLHAGTLGIISGTVLSVSIGLALLVKAARNWAAVRRLLFGCVASAIVLAISVHLTSIAGRAGYISSLDPNDFAFVLSGLLPIVVAFFIVSRGTKRFGYACASIFVLIAILLTQSRGGLLGLVADILVMIFVLPARRRGKLTSGLSAANIVARMLVLAILGALTWHTLPSSARERLATITSLSSDYNMQLTGTGRLAIWTQTLPLATHRPWGYGAGAFVTADGMFAGGRYNAPHNMFLQALIELGVLGMGLLLATIIVSFRYLFRASAGMVEPSDHDALERRAFARGLLASLMGMCVAGFFLSELYSSAFWVVIILTGLVGRSAAAPRPSLREVQTGPNL